jgi:hypothetical protein
MTTAKVTRAGLRLILVVGLAMTLWIGSAAGASAARRPSWHLASSAMGTFTYQAGPVTIKVPSGCFLTVSMKYDESNAGIGTTRAGTDCVGPAAILPRLFCNRKMTFSYYNNDNKRYFFWASQVSTNCKTFTSYEVPYSVRGQYGKMCARFYVAGTHRKTTCIQVHS